MSKMHIETLKTLVATEHGVLLPGAPNALAARIIADLGFKAVYLTGAGLTNIVFAPPGAQLVELFHPDATAVFYRELAGVCGLRYTRLTGRPSGSPKTADFTIDLGELLDLVSQIKP